MLIIRRVGKNYTVLIQRLRSGALLRRAVDELCKTYNPFLAPFIFLRLRGKGSSSKEIPIFLYPYKFIRINPDVLELMQEKIVVPYQRSRKAFARGGAAPAKQAAVVPRPSFRRLPAVERGKITTVIHKQPLSGASGVSDPVVPYAYQSGYNCTVLYPTGNRTSYTTRSLTKISTKTPLWKSLKKADRPFNPHTLIYEEIKTSEGTWGGKVSSWPCVEQRWGLIYNMVASTDTLNRPWPSHQSLDVEARATSKVLEKVKGMKINLGQAYGERKQTVRLITRSVNRVASAALAIRNGNLRHASNLFGDKKMNLRKEIKPSSENLANYWLEFQYGWRPLLQDIHGACEQIANTYFLKRPYRATSISLGESMVTDYQKRYVSNPITSDTWYELVDSKRVASSKVVLEFTEADSLLTALSSVGATNPAALAWELLPYSFVVDWFVPIGDYLGNLDSGAGLQFRRGFRYTKIQQEDQTRWKRAVVDTSNRSGFLTGNTQHRLYRSKVRTVLTSFPLPIFPTFQPSVGATRALSGIALITQLFRGKTSVR